MSQRAARRRRERAARSQTGRGRQKMNPKLLTAITVVGAILIAVGLWYSATSGGGTFTEETVLAGALTWGSEDAPVTIVEFGDYMCPFCRTWNENEFQRVYQEFVEPGLASFKYVHYPFLDAQSYDGAHATKAIQNQDPEAAREFHNALFAAQKSQGVRWMTQDLINDLAERAAPNIDHKRFNEDRRSREVMAEVKNERDWTRSIGINSTPSILVNGERLEGNGFDVIKAAVEEALAEAGISIDDDA